MIVENQNKIEELFESKDLGIVADDMVFSMMMDGIYTDKIGSVIREISTNARDSHIAAGNTAPFEINITSVAEHSFEVSIKDYGLGLSTEEVENYLCKLNASSKRDSNDFVGCFGIGSKSVLAVTNNYNYTCIKDQIVTDLAISRVGKQAPKYETLVYPTDLPNSVECTFTIKEISLNNLLSYVINELLFFDIKPKVTVITDETVVYEPHEIFPKVLDKELFYVVYEPPLSHIGLRTDRMACGIIGYKVDSNIFFKKSNLYSRSHYLPPMCSLDLNHPAYLIPKFKLGTIDFSVSREDISMTPKTERSIEQLRYRILQLPLFKFYTNLTSLATTDARLNNLLSIKTLIDTTYSTMSEEDFDIFLGLFTYKSLFQKFLITKDNTSSSLGLNYAITYMQKLYQRKETFSDVYLTNLVPYNIRDLLDFYSNPNIYRVSLDMPLVYKELKAFTPSRKHILEQNLTCLPVRALDEDALNNVNTLKRLGIFTIYELEEYKEIDPVAYAHMTYKKPKAITAASTAPELTSQGFKPGVKHQKIVFYNSATGEETILENSHTSAQLYRLLKSQYGRRILINDARSEGFLSTTTPCIILHLEEQSDKDEVELIWNTLKKDVYDSYNFLDLSKYSTEIKKPSGSIFFPLNKVMTNQETLDSMITSTARMLWASRLQPNFSKILEELISQVPLLSELQANSEDLCRAYLKKYTKLLEPDIDLNIENFYNDYFQSETN